MTTQGLSLVQAMIQKMDWLEERQKVLAENIANADTPNYRPQDLQPLDFKNLLESSTSSLSFSPPGLATTAPKHMGASPGTAALPKTKEERHPYEVAPAGNAVVLEEQLLKMNQNFTDHQLVSALYQKNIQMMKAALK
jgi:flagellar basal-body rod protein FlgB